MQLTIRSVFAGVLWLLVLVPVALYMVHLSSPEAAVQVVLAVGDAMTWILLGGAAAAAVTLLVYPPFLPTLRLAVRNLRRRLGTDLGPLRTAQERLAHFETAADHLAAGRVLQQQGRLRDAVGHLARAVELEPDHAAGRYQLGLALATAGQLQGAAEQLAAAVQLDPDHAFGGALLELGVVFERGNANEQAVETLAGHTAKFGPHRRALFHRARALARLGRHDEAIELLRQVVEPPAAGRTLPLEDQIARGHARVALLRRGRL